MRGRWGLNRSRRASLSSPAARKLRRDGSVVCTAVRVTGPFAFGPGYQVQMSVTVMYGRPVIDSKVSAHVVE
jgi:hypothetical protein